MHHSLETYLPRLVRAGYKVAVCDQLEDPKLTKNIVKRGVTELVTPGVAFNEQLLEQKEHNYIAGLTFHKDRCGAAFLDVIGGDFGSEEGALAWESVAIGFFSAFLSGLVACRAMIRLVSKGHLLWFALYCFVLGIVTIFVVV